MNPCDTVMLERSTPKTVCGTVKVILNTIAEQISSETLQNVYSVMADTAALNTGKNQE